MQATLDKFAVVVGDKLENISKEVEKVKSDVEDIKDQKNK